MPGSLGERLEYVPAARVFVFGIGVGGTAADGAGDRLLGASSDTRRGVEGADVGVAGVIAAGTAARPGLPPTRTGLSDSSSPSELLLIS